MIPVILSVELSDDALIDALLADPGLGVRRVERDSILGGSELATVILMLTPAILAAAVKILREKWARNGKVSIEARGVKIKGASPDDVEAILRQILERTQEGDG